MDTKSLTAAIEFASEHYEPGTLPHATVVAALINSNALNANTAALNRETEVINEAIAKPKQPEHPKPAAPAAPSIDELKQACLTLARSAADGKVRAKAVLASYGAQKAADVPEHLRGECIGKLKEELKNG